MFFIDDGTPDLFKSLFDLAKLFIKALLSRLLDTSAIEIHYYYYILYMCLFVVVHIFTIYLFSGVVNFNSCLFVKQRKPFFFSVRMLEDHHLFLALPSGWFLRLF